MLCKKSSKVIFASLFILCLIVVSIVDAKPVPTKINEKNHIPLPTENVERAPVFVGVFPLLKLIEIFGLRIIRGITPLAYVTYENQKLYLKVIIIPRVLYLDGNLDFYLNKTQLNDGQYGVTNTGVVVAKFGLDGIVQKDILGLQLVVKHGKDTIANVTVQDLKFF